MANNYCESSSFIEVPEDKLARAKEIVAEVEQELEESEEGYVGLTTEVESRGVWLCGDITVEHLERMVKALVEGLDLTGVHLCSWAYTCSKPRIDEFSGGAFAVQKGKETIWIDAAREAMIRAHEKETQT